MPEANHELHVFANEVTDWVVASDPVDAIKVWEKSTGQEYIVDEYGGEFAPEPDENLFTLYEEETITQQIIPEGAILVEKSQFSHTYRATFRAWADARGRCFLGSTEY